MFGSSSTRFVQGIAPRARTSGPAHPHRRRAPRSDLRGRLSLPGPSPAFKPGAETRRNPPPPPTNPSAEGSLRSSSAGLLFVEGKLEPRYSTNMVRRRSVARRSAGGGTCSSLDGRGGVDRERVGLHPGGLRGGRRRRHVSGGCAGLVRRRRPTKAAGRFEDRSQTVGQILIELQTRDLHCVAQSSHSRGGKYGATGIPEGHGGEGGRPRRGDAQAGEGQDSIWGGRHEGESTRPRKVQI